MNPYPHSLKAEGRWSLEMLRFSTLWYQLCLPFQGQKPQISLMPTHSATCHLHQRAGDASLDRTGCSEPCGSFLPERTRRLGTERRGQRQRGGKVSTREKEKRATWNSRHADTRTWRGQARENVVFYADTSASVSSGCMHGCDRGTITHAWVKEIRPIQCLGAILAGIDSHKGSTCMLCASWCSDVTLSPGKPKPPNPLHPTSLPSTIMVPFKRAKYELLDLWYLKAKFESNGINVFIQVLRTALDFFFFFCPFHKVGGNCGITTFFHCTLFISSFCIKKNENFLSPPFSGHTLRRWKFPGQGLNPSCSCDLQHSSGNLDP